MDLILIIAAIVPAVFLMIRVYKADRLEKEPIRLLLTLLVLGIISTSLASLAEQLGDAVLAFFLPEGTLPYDLLLYFGVVAFAEEGFKYLLLKNRTWKSPFFNCQFDGVVYAVFVSLGFALWENIGYVLRYGMATAIARAITAVPGHACFGVFMGTWYGLAKRYAEMGLVKESARARRLAVLTPALLHGCYDFIATQQTEALSLVFVVFVICMFVAAIRVVKKQSRKDNYIYTEPVYVPGEPVYVTEEPLYKPEEPVYKKNE